MTAATRERETPFAGLVPARGSYKIAANTLIRKGWQVGLDAAGRAVAADTIANGCLSIVGKASSTIDNRTGSQDFSGLADATDVYVEYGVHGWLSKTGGGDDIAQANAGQVCWAVDNQTVALTSNTGTRAIAGYISEVRDGVVYVQQGPTIAGQIVIAAAEASELDTAQTQLAALIVDVTTAKKLIPINVAGATLVAGTPLAAFADAEGATPGLTVENAKAFGVRWNDHATPTAVWTSFALPQDLDTAHPMVVHVLAAKSGNTVGDATKFTIAMFAQTVAALEDAGADLGGDSTAMTGNAAAKTVQNVTYSVAVPPTPPAVCSMSIKPKDGTLGTDDVTIIGLWVEYTRKEFTS